MHVVLFSELFAILLRWSCVEAMEVTSVKNKSIISTGLSAPVRLRFTPGVCKASSIFFVKHQHQASECCFGFENRNCPGIWIYTS